MGMKILSLTTSYSGCERNWSTFEGVSIIYNPPFMINSCRTYVTLIMLHVLQIHTKKRNRLDANRMRDLVYVQFNSKLANKKKKEKHDVLLADDASMAQSWIAGADEDDAESQGSTNIADEMFRDLDEDNFESEGEEVNEELTFEEEEDVYSVW